MTRATNSATTPPREPDPVIRRLLTRLAEVARRADPIPESVYVLGRSALSTRDVDAELAELVRDSAAESASLVGVRGDTDVRLLSFEAPTLDVEVQVTDRGTGQDLLGQVIGQVRGPVVVETAGGRLPAETDTEGRFAVTGLPRSRFRLRLTTDEGVTVVTSWAAA